MIKFSKTMASLSLLIILSLGACESPSQKYVQAPFSALDTLATNDWWNRKTSKIIDMKVPRDQVIAFGIYTISNNTLKLSAQLFPLHPEESRTVKLSLYQNDQWKEIQSQEVNEIGWSRSQKWNLT